MRRTGRILAALVALALAAPAAALAQSAGDEQYTDPFQNVPEDTGGNQGGGGQQGGGNNSGAQGGDQSAPEPVAPPAEEGVVPEDSGVVDVPEATTPAPGGDGVALPRTGSPAVLPALLGMFLLAGGFALRRAA